MRSSRKGRSPKRWLRAAVVVFCVSSLVACGGGSGTGESGGNGDEIGAAPPKESKLDLDVDVMWEEDEAFSRANPDLAGDGADQLNLPRETKLIALVDRVCQEEMKLIGGADTASRDYRVKAESLGEQSLSMEVGAFELDGDTTDAELKEKIKDDICLIKVNNEMKVSTTADPNDPEYAKQKHFPAINASAAFNTIDSGITQDVTIAIVDTGVDYNHPDLRNNMWRNSAGQYGYDFVNKDGDPLDDHFHGTHVAGLAAAEKNNNLGVAGVMGRRAKIMAVKVLGAGGGGLMSDVANGINYAVDNGADVINMSLGGSGESSVVEAAVRNAVSKGVTVLAAAGNNGQQLNAAIFFSPASYAPQINGLLAVGSVDQTTKARSGFSNYNPAIVEIAAPGSGGIYSTLNNNRYGALNGTSMATPIAAGASAAAIGLLKSRGLDRSPATVESLLLASADKRSDLSSYFKNGNMLDLNGLVNKIGSGNPTPTPPPAPSPSPSPDPTPSPNPDEPSGTARVKRWVLVNADTDREIGTLTNGAVITGGGNINIVAEVEGETKRHVYFHLNGKINAYDREAPYSLVGDKGGDFKGWKPATGSYQVKATPTYSAANGSTQIGQPSTINFTVR